MDKKYTGASREPVAFKLESPVQHPVVRVSEHLPVRLPYGKLVQKNKKDVDTFVLARLEAGEEETWDTTALYTALAGTTQSPYKEPVGAMAEIDRATGTPKSVLLSFAAAPPPPYDLCSADFSPRGSLGLLQLRLCGGARGRDAVRAAAGHQVEGRPSERGGARL